MAVKLFNSVTVGAALGIIFLSATLWNLQSREPLYQTLEEGSLNATATPTSEFDEFSVKATETAGEQVPEPTATRLSFLEIATKHGTDKVTVHHYNYMYAKHLEALRDKPLKMLEIGLGCDMAYGPGKSYYTWLEYLPNVDMYYIEYNKECVEHWGANMTNVKVFAGSQEDEAFLDSFINASGGGFDIIIDDGGHTMNQQIVSLQKLFPIIKPGGMYFCEDLATSYQPYYGAVEGATTMMQVIQELLHDLNNKLWSAPPVKHEVGREMRSIECGEEICAFFKKDLEKTEIRV